MADEKPVSIIRPLSVYMDSDKIARAMSGSYKISSGRDPVITDGRWLFLTGYTSLHALVPVRQP